MANDEFWAAYKECAEKLRDEGSTVAAVIRICKSFFGKSSGDAFFPGGSGDVELMEPLLEHGGWRVTWQAAPYHFKMTDQNGARLEYVEGDIYRLHDHTRT